MSDRKLVSVVTGTWNRHDLLMGAIENVRAQAYRPLEHVIVSDGPDQDLMQRIVQIPRDAGVPIRFAECGRNWSSYLAASESAVPFQVAQWLARGEYLIWMADDERFAPDHIEKLVGLLEERDADFVYSLCRIYMKGGDPSGGNIIGTDPPTYGNITNALYRRELLDYRGFRTHIGSGSDIDQVTGWMQAGARWAMLPEVTMSHRADKSGEGPNYRPLRHPLRGQTGDEQRKL